MLAPRAIVWARQCPHDWWCGMAQYQHQTCIVVSCCRRQTVPNQCQAMTLLHPSHPLPCRWDLARSYGRGQLEHLHDVHPLETHHFARCDPGACRPMLAASASIFANLSRPNSSTYSSVILRSLCMLEPSTHHCIDLSIVRTCKTRASEMVIFETMLLI